MQVAYALLQRALSPDRVLGLFVDTVTIDQCTSVFRINMLVHGGFYATQRTQRGGDSSLWGHTRDNFFQNLIMYEQAGFPNLYVRDAASTFFKKLEGMVPADVMRVVFVWIDLDAHACALTGWAWAEAACYRSDIPRGLINCKTIPYMRMKSMCVSCFRFSVRLLRNLISMPMSGC